MRKNPNKFRKYSRAIWLTVVILATLLGLVLGSAVMSISIWVVILGTIVYFVLILLFWRCPHCGMNFPTKSEMAFTNCPYCGQPLPSAKE